MLNLGFSQLSIDRLVGTINNFFRKYDIGTLYDKHPCLMLEIKINFKYCIQYACVFHNK